MVLVVERRIYFLNPAIFFAGVGATHANPSTGAIVFKNCLPKLQFSIFGEQHFEKLCKQQVCF